LKPIPILWPLSIPYQGVIQTRNRLYDLGVLPTYDAGAPVISVGNLSVGGTGKTPFVMHLVDRIRRLTPARKVRLGVISRGYSGRAQGTLVVSDGRKVVASVKDAGDEPALIAEASPGVVVVVDRDRVRGAGLAVKEHRARLLLLDDGFQHRRLRRDLDIVLLEAENPLGSRRVLPAGFLREPARALKRADVVVLSKAVGDDEELKSRASRLQDLIGKPVAVSRLTPKYWRRVGVAELLAPEQVSGRKVAAFAGIASPDSFFDTVRGLGAELTARIPLPDHCRYSKSHLDRVAGVFVRSQADWLVTTAKDAVKLPSILRFLPVYYLEVETRVVAGAEMLDEMLNSVIERL